MVNLLTMKQIIYQFPRYLCICMKEQTSILLHILTCNGMWPNIGLARFSTWGAQATVNEASTETECLREVLMGV